MAKKKSKDSANRPMKPQQSFADMVSDAQIAKLGPLVQQMVYQAMSPLAQQQMNQYAELVTRVLVLQDIIKDKLEITDEMIEEITADIVKKSQENAEVDAKVKEMKEETAPEEAKMEDYFPVKEENNEDAE